MPKEKLPGKSLSGKISNRIRRRDNDIPKDVDLKFKGNTEEIPPKPSSVRGGKGQGLGEGATRRRSGDK